MELNRGEVGSRPVDPATVGAQAGAAGMRRTVECTFATPDAITPADVARVLGIAELRADAHDVPAGNLGFVHKKITDHAQEEQLRRHTA